MQKHRDVLLELAQSNKSDLERALQKICSVSAATLDVARVSYWSVQEDDSAISCEVRREPPEITFEKYRHHISPITGIVRGVYPSPWRGFAPLRTYVAGHNFALINDSLYFLKDGLRSHSSGKGRTDAQARTSAR